MAEKGETVAGETPLIKIITVASIGAGVQFGWALQLSLLTPYVQTLGVPHMWSSFIWLCGPLSGLIVQPIVGYSSDRCKSRFGRRRPFIATGGFLVAVAIFLIGFSKDLGYHAGDPLDHPFKPRAVAMFVVGFWLLDIANNMLQDPCRAFLADLSGNNHKKTRVAMGWYAFFMALGNTLGYAAGSYSGFYKIFTFTKTIACDAACANLKSVFIIDIVLLLLIVTLATTTVPEKLAGEADDHHTDGDEAQKRSAPFIGELISVIKSLKKPTWLLLLVTCINWIAWFPFLLYDTDWMGMEVYGGDVNGSAEEKRMYDIGVRAGAMGLMFNSIVQGFSALALEPLGRMLGGVQKVWGIVNIILAIGLGATVWVSKVAEAWRHNHGSVVLPPPSNVVGGAWTIFALLGIPLSVTFSIPFALGSIYNKVDGAAGNGLTLGVINLAIVIPQVVVSVSAGRLDAAFGGGNLPAFVLGAIAALISALLAMFVLPSPPPQTQTVIVPAGGH